MSLASTISNNIVICDQLSSFLVLASALNSLRVLAAPTSSMVVEAGEVAVKSSATSTKNLPLASFTRSAPTPMKSTLPSMKTVSSSSLPKSQSLLISTTLSRMMSLGTVMLLSSYRKKLMVRSSPEMSSRFVSSVTTRTRSQTRRGC